MTITTVGEDGRSPHIVVVGSMAVDVKYFDVGRCRSSVEDLTVWQLERQPGGIGRNVAVNLARLGVQVSFVALSGPGQDGSSMERELTNLGVSVVSHHASSGVGTVELVLGEDGLLTSTRITLPHPIESLAMQNHAVDRILASADGVMVETGLHPQFVGWIRERTARSGVSLCGMPTRLQDALPETDHVSGYDVVVLNRREAARLLGERAGGDVANAARNASELCSPSSRAVVVTCGADGAVLAVPEQEALHLAAEEASCLDDTGAGDALASAFFAKLVRGESPVEALRSGLRAAGTTVQCRTATCAKLEAM